MRWAVAFLWCLTIFDGAAIATPWQVKEGLVNDANLAKLRERHKDIEDAAKLQALLRDVARRQPLRYLNARYVDGYWLLEGERAELIAELTFSGVARYIRNSLYGVTRNFVGQVDSEEVRRKLRQTILSYMIKRGYPKAVVELTIVPDGNVVSYEFEIKALEPCVIDAIQYGVRLPKGARFDVDVGQICDEEDIAVAVSELEETLRELGFNQARIDSSATTYDPIRNTSVLVLSGAVGQRVRYQIVDRKKRFLIDDIFSDDELTDIDPTIVGPDAMAVELGRRYRNRGFLDIAIEGPRVGRATDDEIIYTYEVDPGPQYLLRDLDFEGVTVFEREDLPKIMDLDTIWQTSQPLNLEELKAGIDALRSRYQEEGYWDVDIRDPGTGSKAREAGTVRMTISVKEGKGRILKEVIVRGNQAFNAKEIVQLFAIENGAALDRAKLVDFQQALRTLYISRGYLYAKIDLDLVPFEGRKTVPVEVLITIDEGERVKIGEVSVAGLIKTEESVVRRELLFKTGDWYDPERLNETRRRLSQLGLFQSVQIVPTERNNISEGATELDLVVEVREAPAGNVSFGPGWSSYSGWRYTAEAGYNNIGGVGRQVTLRGTLSEEKQQAAIGPRTLVGRQIAAGYLEPYLFEWPVDGSVGVSHRARATEDFWELSFAGEVGITHRLRHILVGSTISTYYGQKITREEGAPEKEDELITGNVRIGRVGIRYRLDRRDSVKFPTDGFTLETELEWAQYALGGDLQYFKLEARNNYYFGLMTDVVLALGWEVTSYDNVQRQSTSKTFNILPPSERLFSGGRDSVRGYEARSLGPIVRSPVFETKGGERIWNCGYKTSSLGGSRRSLLQTELRYKWTEDLASAFFVDSGNTFFSAAEMQQFGKAYAEPLSEGFSREDPCAGISPARSVEDNVGYEYQELLYKPGYLISRHYLSYGLSINFLTPIGSLTVAYGLPWLEPKTERCQEEDYCFPRGSDEEFWLLRGELHINVGAKF